MVDECIEDKEKKQRKRFWMYKRHVKGEARSLSSLLNMHIILSSCQSTYKASSFILSSRFRSLIVWRAWHNISSEEKRIWVYAQEFFHWTPDPKGFSLWKFLKHEAPTYHLVGLSGVKRWWNRKYHLCDMTKYHQWVARARAEWTDRRQSRPYALGCIDTFRIPLGLTVKMSNIYKWYPTLEILTKYLFRFLEYFLIY